MLSIAIPSKVKEVANLNLPGLKLLRFERSPTGIIKVLS